MRIVPTLLRLILALGLVLNGTGLATAHAGNADAISVASAAVQEVPIDEAPCHEVPDPGASKQKPDAGKAEGEAANGGTAAHHSGADCCDMDTCDNACPQPLSAALLAAVATGLHVPPVSNLHTLPPTWVGPRLSHPIRPPIA